jgi:hypothetical protein
LNLTFSDGPLRRQGFLRPLAEKRLLNFLKFSKNDGNDHRIAAFGVPTRMKT